MKDLVKQIQKDKRFDPGREVTFRDKLGASKKGIIIRNEKSYLFIEIDEKSQQRMRISIDQVLED